MNSMQALAIGVGYVAVGLAAVGSAIGAGTAGAAAIGAWKKCYQQGKAAPFLLIAMVGAPLSQTIYAMLMMVLSKQAIVEKPQYALAYVCMGLLGGIAQMVSAIFQGRCGANGCVSFAETGKGFANYLIVLGVVETCAIFALVFSFMAMP
ncbi:MAG: V-type ATP synthase subunit K [Lentisphaerae bacterium]|nr:V-type ATP synthase subunit K [Lentisphaerota bacterium]